MQDAFDLYHQVQELSENSALHLDGPTLPALGNAIVGAIGASVSNVCTYPLALIVTRPQIQRQLRKGASSFNSEIYESLEDAIRDLRA